MLFSGPRGSAGPQQGPGLQDPREGQREEEDRGDEDERPEQQVAHRLHGDRPHQGGDPGGGGKTGLSLVSFCLSLFLRF